jgi:hypothetical protein
MTVALPLDADEPWPIELRAYRGPSPEPPYDDDGAPVPESRGLRPWPGHHPRVPLRLVPSPDEALKQDPWAAPKRTPREELEEPLPRATVLARALLEAVAGDRPLGQLMRWTTPEVFASLEPLLAARASRPWAATVRRVLVAEPTPGVAEVTAIVDRGPRAGVMALRMEGLDGRWLVTALQLG